MSRSTDKQDDGLTKLLSKMIKQVKVISTGRIQCHSTFDITRLEREDDGTYTIILEI
jgi:hypothetical protein